MTYINKYKYKYCNNHLLSIMPVRLLYFVLYRFQPVSG